MAIELQQPRGAKFALFELGFRPFFSAAGWFAVVSGTAERGADWAAAVSCGNRPKLSELAKLVPVARRKGIGSLNGSFCLSGGCCELRLKERRAQNPGRARYRVAAGFEGVGRLFSNRGDVTRLTSKLREHAFVGGYIKHTVALDQALGVVEIRFVGFVFPHVPFVGLFYAIVFDD